MIRARLIAAGMSLAFALTARGAGAQSASNAAAPPTAPVAARTIPRGTTLAAVDIATDSADDIQAAALVGWITRRIVHEGEPLRAPAIAPPHLVHAGGLVTISAIVEGVAASRDGTALADASLGEHVRVRLDAQRIITGTVTGPSLVRIP
jgi:flagella basal body P-ring formation protein FlgA